MPDIKNLRPSDYPYPQLRETPSGDCSAMPCSACCGSGQQKGDNEHEWETFMETCEACKGSGTLEIEDCPDCDNVGWYIVPDSEGQPTMAQCQWCYTVPNGRFNSLPNAEVTHPESKP